MTVEEDKAMTIHANQCKISSEMSNPAPQLDPNDEDISFMDEEEDNSLNPWRITRRIPRN
jgi:hypothetical protein